MLPSYIKRGYMKQQKSYENYPHCIVAISIFLQLAIFIIGAYIIHKLGLIWLVLYLIYILILEFRLLKNHCTDCYYYGKKCAFGRGKLCSLLFKKGNPKSFSKIKVSWKSLFLDFLVSLIPIVVGIILLIIKFNLTLLILVILLFLLSSIGNAIIRGSLACKYCKQRKIGCPAEKLFNKKNKKI
jgi:hypothetical protein